MRLIIVKRKKKNDQQNSNHNLLDNSFDNSFGVGMKEAIQWAGILLPALIINLKVSGFLNKKLLKEYIA